jgi:hypothetical protein
MFAPACRIDVSQAAGRFVGMVGTVVSDDRDGLPFGVTFDTAAGERRRPNAYFALDELVPVGTGADGLSLRELPQRFSTAPPAQLALAGLLGAANLGAVLYLGNLLGRIAGVPAAAFGSSGPLVLLLRRAYLPLLAYASGFVAVPAVRAAVVRRRNRAIDERNERRRAWGRALFSAPEGTRGRRERGSGTEGEGFRARVARKLQAARALRPRLRRFRRGEDAAYSTANDLADAAASGASLAGDSLDEFDRRLAQAAEQPRAAEEPPARADDERPPPPV